MSCGGNWLPNGWRFGWCCAATLIWLVTLGTASVGAHDLVIVQEGDLPVVITAPHGGTLPIPGVQPRSGERLAPHTGKFVTSRDTATDEVALELAARLEIHYGRKPFLILSRAHRRYLDPNRPREAAFECPAAQVVYDAYHAAVDRSCRAVQERFRSGLLLDIHGQAAVPDAVLRGTQNGLTVTRLRERAGEPAHSGTASLFGCLRAAGLPVFPDVLTELEHPAYGGGHTVRTYGSHQPAGLDAIQLELGANLRTEARLPATTTALAKAVIQFADQFYPVPQAQPVPASSPHVTVAVYVGEGTSQSRTDVLRVLRKQPRYRICELTADDIQAGAWKSARLLLHPGGSGSAQGRALGPEGRRQIREFVRSGGSYLGICAGAYLATCDYDWSLGILDAKVVDRSHWNRGYGDVRIELTERGRSFFRSHSPPGVATIYYHQGPLLAPANDGEIPDYEGLASFASEITENGAPRGVMPGTTAIAIGTFGQGRVACFSPHPEKTLPREGLLLDSLRWCLGEPSPEPRRP